MDKIKLVNRIRFKITGAMILCSLMMALLIGAIVIHTNYNFLNIELTENLELLPKSYSNSFNGEFKAIESSANTLNNFISESFDLNQFNANPKEYLEKYEKMMDPIIKRTAETTSKVHGVYFTFNPELTGVLYESWYADLMGNGVFKKQKEGYLQDFYLDNKEMQWYYEPILKKKGIWGKPTIDNVLKIWLISYTRPVYKGNVLLGVVGMDISMEAMKKLIGSLKTYQTGYSALFDEKYNFLIHPLFSPEDNLGLVESGRYKSLVEEMEKKDSGIVKYQFQGKNKMLGYSRLSNGWVLVFIVPMSEVYLPLIEQIIWMVGTNLMAICSIILITLYIGKSISRPITKITKLIINTGTFKFDEDESLKFLVRRKDEIGIMAQEMVTMQRILKDTGVHRAAQLQEKALQKEFPIPDKVHMKVLYIPSKMVSGDFYHMQLVNESKVIGILFDVSGKGVTAALNTYAIYVLFHEAVLKNQEPVEILQDLNSKTGKLFEETYVAACCFSFDFERNTAKVAGAGINQFMYSSAEEKYQEKQVKGSFLGMFEESIFDQETIHFKKGDVFYFFTDGLEFLFLEQVKNQISQISDDDVLIKFLNAYREKSNISFNTIVDDCTFIALEIKEVEDEIVKLSGVDEITGLLNRRSGLLLLERQFEKAKMGDTELTICFLSIDGLKLINNKYGRSEGDWLIRIVADLIQQSIRKEDAACRVDGNEFLLIIAGGRVCAEMLWARVNENIEIINQREEKPYKVSVSHGFEEHRTSSAKSLDDFISEADKKMVKEKIKHKGQRSR